MASIDANLCSLSAEVRSYLFWTIEWPVMNVAADQDSTSNDSVQPKASLVQNRNGAPRPERGNSIAVEHVIIGGKEGK